MIGKQIIRMSICCWILLSLTLINGCGFQLNRNKIQLPDGASSIFIYKITNNSFIPRLDLDLKDKLIGKFTQNSVDVLFTNQADMVLSATIVSLTTTKSEYSLDDTGQTYEHTFAANARLTVYNNLTQVFYLNNVAVKSSYSIKNEDSDLSSTDEDDGRSHVLDNLSEEIAEKLTDSF